VSGTGRGTLVLVVGPSGAGKDSIIAGAAQRFREEPRVVFARRLITRPADSAGEDHLAVSPADFAALRDKGRLMLHWHAHGLDYGLPLELAQALAGGCSVVANVSRTIVTEARRRFPPVMVVAVRAPPEILAARLAGRGREDAADIESRLLRGERISSDQADFVIVNDGPLDAAVDRFAELLRSIRPQPASG
jgi:phosphonate metabolism protein PhnN/1,5-bisphosphokinase (PRPP-forming)